VVRVDQFCECGTKLGHNPRRKGNRCQPCAMRAVAQDPVKRAKSAAAMKAFYETPGAREATGARVAKAYQERVKVDPAYKERFQEIGRRLGTSDKRGNAPAGSPPRKLAAQRQSATVLADIPLEYRDEHRKRVKNHGIKAADSKRMVAEQVERDTERFLATGKLQQTKDGR
jgi:hypothetical protein